MRAVWELPMRAIDTTNKKNYYSYSSNLSDFRLSKLIDLTMGHDYKSNNRRTI
ncbi:hypothetical protein SAMN05444364_12237 [Prevotella scopos JCM 17725]|uniref:Uncharacterized protein n=1 Tax=Prevotella scopos JCM 17725 TaxID=1236518 RepID=A0AAX2F5C7_9BACT|nr:hypothetical protein SAMN05444364_12237 [Prevotella scopos JCM 17725]